MVKYCLLLGLVLCVCRKIGSHTGFYRKSVAALVLRVAVVALKPVEGNVMRPVQGDEAKPEIQVLDLGKALCLPFLEPAFRDCLNHVRRVAPHLDVGATPLDSLQALDDGQKLHAVIGSKPEAAAHFFAKAAAHQHHAVTARARIARGRAVRKQVYGWMLLCCHRLLFKLIFAKI